MNPETNNLRPVNDPQLHEFILFCKSKLGYKHKAVIKVSDDHEQAKEYKSMGAFFPEEQVIWILRGKRVRADWYRSLAHELVHHMQRDKGQELDGSTGSDCENEANGTAGLILREWGAEHPEIFEQA